MNNRIKKIRKEVGLTQQSFANRIGIARGNISAYEVGKNAPSDAVISLICREFNINEQWLRFGDGEMKQNSDMDFEKICADIGVRDEKAKEAIMKYYELSEDDKKLWWQFMERFMQ